MSAHVRARLAEVASSVVEKVNVTPSYRQSLTAGQGAVRRDRTTYEAFGGVVTWQVWIVLPKDPVTAQEWLDDVIPDVADALATSRELTVQSVEPQQLALDNGNTYPIALITGTREQE